MGNTNILTHIKDFTCKFKVSVIEFTMRVVLGVLVFGLISVFCR